MRRNDKLRLLARLCAAQSGSVAVETTLAFMVLMTLVLGIVEFSIMGYTYSVFAEAARQGVRYATFHGTASSDCSGPSTGCGDPAGGNVAGQVTQYASSLAGNVTDLKVNVSYPDGSSAAPSRVLVTVGYTYRPMFNFPGLAQPFTISSEGRIFY